MTSPAATPRRRLWGPSRGVEPYTPTAWHTDHRIALAGIVGATVLTLLIGLLGPSVIAVDLGPRDGSLLPPWYLPKLPAPPNEWLVTSLTWLLLLVGAAGLFIALRALRAGWRPRPRRMFGLGVAMSTVTALIPPLTSADVLMYAAYGRLQLLGRNPYEISPAEIFRSQFDAVLTRTERPWEDTPSVYGPITSWLQLAANHLGGENMHDIVFWLQVFHLLAFLGACAATIWIARGDRDRLNRAILLTVLNPLMIWAVIATAHNEALSVVFAVGGMMLMRRNGFGAGLGIGLAGCAKLSIGLWGLAMLWAYRRQPKKAALLCLGAGIPIGLAYGLWQPQALISVLRNGTYVSSGSWAQPVDGILHGLIGERSTLITGVISYTMLVVLAFLLSRVLPWSPVPGIAEGVDPRRDEMTVAVRTALVLSTAWLVAAMYTLSWYDLIAFIPLGVLAASRLDSIFVVRNTFLALAFVPGRAIDFGEALDATATRVREIVSPLVQIGVIASIVVWYVQRRRAATRGDGDEPADRPADGPSDPVDASQPRVAG